MPNWDKQHHLYQNEDWINKPSIFAHWAVSYFPNHGSVIDLGGGQGQDSRYFSDLGFKVTLVDYSDVALYYFERKSDTETRNKIINIKHDLREPLPFEDESYDVVYSHLALHYFDNKTTYKLFDEIYRILKPNGVLVALLNSTSDPEYYESKINSDGLIKVDDVYKRYFNLENIKPFIENFYTEVLDDKGETYKDRAKGVDHLIRYVGSKKSWKT